MARLTVPVFAKEGPDALPSSRRAQTLEDHQEMNERTLHLDLETMELSLQLLFILDGFFKKNGLLDKPISFSFENSHRRRSLPDIK